MNIQDRKKSLTAEELRRRYNLDGLNNDRKSIQLIRNTINKIEIEFQQFMDIINASLKENPNQVDITTWFFDGIPTSSQPEFDDKLNHLGDLYYDRASGNVYQYVYENFDYIWQEKTEPNIVEVLSVESSKADTSDNKRIIFNGTPITPYSIGDVWINNGTYYRCRAARESGNYNIVDWIIYTDYTEDMVLLDTRAVVDQLKTTITQDYVSKVQLETNTQGIYANVSSTYATQTTVSTLDDEVQNTKTEVQGIDTRLSVEEGKVSSIIQQIGDRTGKSTSLTQDIESIASQISDIADVTVSSSTTEATIASSELQNVSASYPIRLEVHPVSDNISYLYPYSGLYPSSTTYLKTRTIRFTNITTNEIFDYVLPDDLLYYDANTYDTFVADYENRTVQITKKCKYNADGSVGTQTATTTSYSFADEIEANLDLTQGNYEVSLLGYSSGYIFVRLMAANAYTAQYATKVELSSSIRQTKTDITSEVAATYATKDTTNSLSTRINQTVRSISLTANDNETSCGLVIKLKNEDGTELSSESANITLSGLVKITDLSGTNSTTIDGSNIKTGTISTNRLSSDVITTSNFSAQNINADNITSGTLTSRAINNGNGTFSVTAAGALTATNATITGTITATAGEIGGCSISGGQLQIDNAHIGSLSVEKITTGTNSQNLTFTGSVTCNKLYASNSGRIGGWTISPSKLGGDNTYLNPNGECQFYPTGGAIVGWNNAIRLKGPSGIAIYNSHTAYGGSTTIDNGIHIMADLGNLNLMNENSSYGVNIRAYCSPSTIGNAGQRSIRLAAGANISMYAVSGYVYAQGTGVSSDKVKTDSGSASSKNVKTNIVEFKDEEYQKALNLLKNIKIYNYDYKYDLYEDRKQYGFILDEIEEVDNKFFKVSSNKAIVKGEHLDFNLDNKQEKDEIIEVKKYDSDTLDKYLLTCIKGLQNKIEKLEKVINYGRN